MLAVLLLAFSLSIDAFSTGLSYGVRKITVPFVAKAIVSGFALVFTALSLFVGSTLTLFLPEWVCKWVGIIILFCIGVFTIWGGLTRKDEVKTQKEQCEKTVFSLIIKSLGITINIIKNPSLGDMDGSKRIEPIEALYVGIALSIDSLGVGIAAAALSISSVYIPIAVAVTQYLFLTLGGTLGKKISDFNENGKGFVVASGSILVALALFRVFS